MYKMAPELLSDKTIGEYDLYAIVKKAEKTDITTVNNARVIVHSMNIPKENIPDTITYKNLINAYKVAEYIEKRVDGLTKETK